MTRQLEVMHHEKDIIGRTAAQMVQPSDAIFMDCGSTAAAMSRYIPQNIDIIVVCSTVNSAG